MCGEEPEVRVHARRVGVHVRRDFGAQRSDQLVFDALQVAGDEQREKLLVLRLLHRSDQLGEPALGGAPEQVHLEEPILGLQVPLDGEAIDGHGAKHVRDVELVVRHADVSRERRDDRLAAAASAP